MITMITMIFTMEKDNQVIASLHREIYVKSVYLSDKETNPAKPESDRSQRSEVSAESFDVDRCR